MENNKNQKSFIALAMNPYFIISLGVFIFYGRLLFGYMPYTGDFLTYQLPEKTLIRECLQQGIMPYINPYILSGTPMLANIATGSLYPLNFILLFGSPVFGFNLFLFVHLLLAGWAMCMFLNHGLKINKHIACLAGLSYSLGGCLWGMIDKGFIVSPWLIPLFFLGVIYFFENGIKRKYGWLISVTALTFLFYSGNLLETYFSIVMAGGAILWSAFNEANARTFWRRAFKNIVNYAFMVLTAIFLAAPQLIPTFKASLISYRSSGIGVADAQHWSFPFMRTIEYFIPFAFGAREGGGAYYGDLYINNPLHDSGGSPWFDSVFVGFPILCAVIFSLIISVSLFVAQRRKEDCRICHSFLKNRDLILFAGLGFFFVLALGKATPLYQLCYVTLPGFKVFRHPEKYIEWVNIFLIIIGAFGLQKLFLMEKKDEAVRVFRIIILTMLSLLFCLFVVAVVLFLVCTEKYSQFFQGYGSRWDGERIFMWQATALITSITSLVLMFVTLRLFPEKPKKIIHAFILFSLLNFTFWSYHIDWTVPVKTFNDAVPWNKLLPEFDHSKWRIYATRQFKYIPSSPKLAIYTSLDDNAVTLQRLRIPSGFSALLQQKYIDYFNFKRYPAKRLLDLLSVKYIAAPLLPDDKIPDGCFFIKQDKDSQYMILENRHAIPRYAVYRKFFLANKHNESDKVFKEAFNPDSFVLTDLPVNFNPDIAIGKKPNIKILRDLPGSIIVEVTKGPCWLVMRDWYSPGWICVDHEGQNIPIVSVEGGLIGAFVNEENMVLKFYYHPPGLNAGLIFGVLGLLMFVFMWLFFKKVKK